MVAAVRVGLDCVRLGLRGNANDVAACVDFALKERNQRDR